ADSTAPTAMIAANPAAPNVRTIHLPPFRPSWVRPWKVYTTTANSMPMKLPVPRRFARSTTHNRQRRGGGL
ncbi:MAG: hypothetical protein ACRC1K_21335, partial [Planctomycetia bacterium]